MSNQKYEAFLKVHETGSFKEAAQLLGYTQAGVSYLINSLEKELGMTLFVRDYGGAHLSAEGQNILPWIQDVCNAERRLTSRLGDLKHLEGGVLRVGTFTSTAIQWLPGITKAYLAQHPAIDVQISISDDQDELEEMIWRGDIDCGFVVLPVKQELETISLRHDPMMVVLPQNHPLANETAFPLKALSEYPYIRLKSGVFSEIDAFFEQHKIQPPTRFVIDSDYAVMSMVSEGLGYSVLPGLILRGAAFPLVSMPPEIPAQRELALALRSSTTASGATKAFVDIAQTWVTQAYAQA